MSGFPKILHQTWKTRDLSGIEEFRLCAASWRRHHPHHVPRLWDDRDNARFVRERFPDYAVTWAAFDKHIKRLDAIRYMWMYVHGGIYADLDLECLRSLDGLLETHGDDDVLLFCDLAPDGRCLSANPALLVSKPGCGFWLEVLAHARRHRDAYVTHATGPFALGRVASRLRSRFRIRCLDQNRLFIRKTAKPFYTGIPGNEDDPRVYAGVFATTDKPEKFEADRAHKLVADWHGTPRALHWHREYEAPRRGARVLERLASRLRAR